MNFKESRYYDEEFLGKYLYNKISNDDKIYSVQEFFGVIDNQKEYHIKGEYMDCKLTVQEEYYELDCEEHDDSLYIVFDKPVHITGEFCIGIFAPEIVIKKSNTYSSTYKCVVDKLIINNNCKDCYDITCSKINSIHFYNSKVTFWDSEVNDFFILNKNLCFKDEASFLNFHKIKCIGKCEDLKNKLLKDKNFKQGVIHIE